MVWYATREDVKDALDYKETARADTRVDHALETASRIGVEGLTHRPMYPQQDVRYFDWPAQYARPWRLWLESNELISVTELYSNGAVIPPENYFLRRADGRNGPPYTLIELNLDTSAAFGGSTQQRAIRITGLWGHRDDQAPAGTAVGSLDTANTSLIVSDGAVIGVGSLLSTAAGERLEVTARRMTDTGQPLTGALTAQTSGTAVPVDDGATFTEGEMLLVDAERMQIIDIAGNTLVVKRAWDGSVLTAHEPGAPVYAARRLTVTRGVLGTTAAPVADGGELTVWQPPGGIRSLAIAEASNTLLLEQSGYARNVRSGVTGGVSKAASTVATAGLDTLRQQVVVRYGRQGRLAAV